MRVGSNAKNPHDPTATVYNLRTLLTDYDDFLTTFENKLFNNKMTVKRNKKAALTPYYETDFGQAYLGDSLELMKQLPDSSINLILTSPPFALTRQKEYGNKQEQHYIDWFMQFSKEFYRLLADNGSLVIDLGGAYLPGHPVRSIYQYELLVRLCREQNFFLAQEFFPLQPCQTSNTSGMGDSSQN